MATAEGKKIPFIGPENIEKSILETFSYEGPRQEISYKTEEFSAVCPFSGLPDFGTLLIEYVPNRACVELKSLKYYLLSYRNVGVYQEHAISHLYRDIFDCLKPHELTVTLTYKTRGGIDTVTKISSRNQ